MVQRVKLAGLLLALALLGVACGDSPTEPEPFHVDDVQFAEELDVTVADLETRESGLFVHDVALGGEPAVDPEGSVDVHLTLWLPDGTLIGDSREQESPQSIDLGDPDTNLIAGFEEGLLEMNEGGVRVLVLPPELGYGAAGWPDVGIPPDSGLVFRLEVVSVTPSSGTT